MAGRIHGAIRTAIGHCEGQQHTETEWPQSSEFLDRVGFKANFVVSIPPQLVSLSFDVVSAATIRDSTFPCMLVLCLCQSGIKQPLSPPA